MDKNLPVIILRGLVLLPSNELKLEFEDDLSIKILDMSYAFHDGRILVVSKDDYDGSIDDLPKIGVEAKITNKIVLPNGKIRISLKGIKRKKILNYIKLKASNSLEAIIEDIEVEKLDEIEKKAIIRKIIRELEYYINNVPNVGNSVLSVLQSINDVGDLLDTIVPAIPLSLERLNDYLNETKPSERARMFLLDIYREEELFNIERNLDIKVTKEFDKNQRDYLLREKLKQIKEELGEISSKEEEINELKNKLDSLNVNDDIKAKIAKIISRYESLSNMSPELNIERTYIDTLLSLPWNNKTIDNEDLNLVKKKLDDTHSGLDKVKSRIIEYLAVKKNTNSLKSPIICLVGPPGVGKTSLAFSIADAVNRKFTKISVGGLDDEAEILGHRRTYIGARPGKIITGIIKAGSNNPVFLIDEIDKMTKNVNGDPASALLEVLDPEQNKYFEDNYLDEQYDLSNIMFILTANDIKTIPAPLKDRLEIIKLDGYTEYEKLDITKSHLIPKICKQMGIDSITIKDDVILRVINLYTKEAGIRELERKISEIIRKALVKVMTGELENMPTITLKNLTNYLGKPIYEESVVDMKVGIVKGLAYTEYGGEIIPIESNYYKGKSEIILTGSLGDVMKESAHIAYSYIRSNYKTFKIPYEKLEENTIHIHALEGAVPKEGPSAGITLTTSILSSLLNIKVKSDIAMTGEISLHGDILKIGGLKEKSLAALRNGIKEIIIPYDNKSEVEDFPKEILDRIKFIPVKNYKEVFKIIKES